MTYRGVVNNGVVLIDGDKPADGTIVEVTPIHGGDSTDLSTHPAVGIWKDRTDLPDDPVQVSKLLGERLMARDDE